MRKVRDPALLGALALGSGVLLRRVFRKLGFVSAGDGGGGEPGMPETLLGLASVIEASEGVITSATLEGVITGWNPGAERLYGYSADEAIGRTVWEIMGSSRGANVVLPNIEKVKWGEPVGPFDAVHHARDGRPLNVSVSLVPIKDQTGEVVGIAVMSCDVTKRKKAEEEFKRSEERDRRLLENSLDAIVVISEGKIAFVNAAGARLAGADGTEELVGKPYLEFVHPDYQATVTSMLSQAQGGEPAGLLQQKLLRLDGSAVDAETTAIPSTYEGKPATQIIIRDVTGRKRAEEDLKESEERYRAVVEQTTEGVYLIDGGTGYVLAANPALREMLGYASDELRGMHIHDLIAQDPEYIDRNLQRTLEMKRRFVGDRKYRKKDGSVLEVEVRAGVISYGGREVVCVVVHDIAERKESEKALRASEARFRTVIEQSPLSIHIFEPGGRSLRANESWNVLWNLGEGEKPEGTNVLEDKQIQETGLLPYIEESVAESRPVFTPPLLYGPSRTGREGEPRWLRSSVYPVEDETGQVIEMALIIEDVTESKRAEEALRESEERFHALTNASFEAVVIVEEGKILEVNRAYAAMFGYEPSKLVGEPATKVVAPESVDLVRRKILSGDEEPYEAVGIRRDGKRFDVEIRGRQSSYRGRSVRVTAIRDVTERKKAVAALRESEERFRIAFEDAPIGAALVDLDRRYLQVNRAVCEMLSYSEEELLEKHSWEITHPDDLEKSAARTHRALEEGAGSQTLEKRYIRADGQVVWALSSISLVRDSRGNPDHFVSLFQDMTGRKELEERLAHQAFHDPLTGLANRALFMDRLEHTLARVNRRKEPIAVLFMDLDNFKVINDSLGHEIGDRLLVEVARRLKECVRPEDTVARFGGDEFVVLLEGVADLGGATRVADRIIESLTDPFDLEGREVFISTSIGIAPTAEAPDEPEDLLRNADLALYRAKEKGKAQYEIFDASMGAEALKRLELESALRRALERGEFRIYYQPKISVSDNKIVSLEALVRWEHPERGLLEPNEFLPVAEETGLIVQIGEWVLGEVCRQGQEWQERFADYSPPRVCTNISPRQFLRTDLVGKVADTLQDSGLRAQNLSLEIAEGVLMDDAGANIEKLEALNDLGIHIVIDDFGTAYSSLAQLKNFPLNILKIDRSLTLKLGERPEDNAIVSAMINLAQALGWAVTAQGVENEEQLKLLRELGCDIVQGYYFTKPVTSEEATVLLENNLSTTV